MDKVIRPTLQSLDVENLLGIVALLWVQHAQPLRVRRERFDLGALFGRQNDVGGDRAPRDDVTIRALGANAKFTWRRYMRSIGAAERFSTSITMSNALSPSLRTTRRVDR
jgi:hypothetical protein